MWEVLILLGQIALIVLSVIVIGICGLYAIATLGEDKRYCAMCKETLGANQHRLCDSCKPYLVRNKVEDKAG